MRIKSLIATLFLSICFSFYSFSQIVEKASLMKIRDPYNEAQRHHIYNALPNGNKLLSGTVGYSMQYNNWILTNSDSLSPSLRYYIALFNESDSLLWVKYLNGYVRAADSDAKNNVYLTGTYKSRLRTSDGDILGIPSNSTNAYGNVFVMKFDSTGNLKWWHTSDNEAVGQAEPYGDYIKIDDDQNVYIAGHYDEFIRFTPQIAFAKQIASSSFIPFLMKLDSSGVCKWVRDWNFDSALPCGLAIDSCKIYMFGEAQSGLRIRSYDFSGRLVDKNNITFSSAELFWANCVNVKDNRIVLASLNEYQKSIGYYDLNGTKIWTVNYTTGIAMLNLQFTRQGRIFFTGVTSGNTNKVGDSTVSAEIFFGYMDTTGTILSVKSLQRVGYSGAPFLSESGRLYINSVVNYHSNLNSSSFVVDTIVFNNLSYYDSLSGIGSGIYYRLLNQYNLNDGLYFNPGTCFFSPLVDDCLDREGIKISGCSIPTFINNLDFNNSIKIYPNPAQNILKIDFQGYQFQYKSLVQLVDINGVIVKEFDIITNSHIDVSGLRSGIYFVKISLKDKRNYSRKILIIH